jgi:hypothetical protein
MQRRDFYRSADFLTGSFRTKEPTNRILLRNVRAMPEHGPLRLRSLFVRQWTKTGGKLPKKIASNLLPPRPRIKCLGRTHSP